MVRRVAVIGVGAIGAQALWQLSLREDVEVEGFERFSVGHGFGASGGDGRVFRTVQYENPGYVPLIQRSERLWGELEAETGQHLRVITGGLVVGTSTAPQISTALEGVERFGQRVDRLAPDELRRRFPQQTFHDDDLGLYDHGAGLIRPELTIIATVAAAERRGARVFEHVVVEGIDEQADGVLVRADGEVRRYDAAVIATGAWAPQLAGAAASEIQPRKVISAWYYPRESGALEGLPGFVRTMPHQFYGVPSQDGLSIKLGLSGIHHRDVDSPDASDYVVREENYRAFRSLVADYFPSLFPRPFRLETYFEGYTPDARPVLQRPEEDSRITYALGFSGHGFKLAPVYGEIAAMSAMGEAADPDAGFLRRDFASAGLLA